VWEEFRCELLAFGDIHRHDVVGQAPGGQPAPFVNPRLLSPLSLLLRHSKAEPADLVILNELNSGMFERYLDPDQCRNIAGDWATAFFDPLNRGRPDPGGFR
jgi:hypothetical protein